jgi:hypothetical protein
MRLRKRHYYRAARVARWVLTVGGRPIARLPRWLGTLAIASDRWFSRRLMHRPGDVW